MAGYLKDKSGQTVMTRLNAPVLRTLAQKSEGKYIDGLTEPDLGLSYVESLVGNLEKQELQARVQTFYVDRFMWPLALALLFWLLGTALSPGGRAAHRTEGALLLLLALYWSEPAVAQTVGADKPLFERPEPQIEAGIQALQQADYEAAQNILRKPPEKPEHNGPSSRTTAPSRCWRKDRPEPKPTRRRPRQQGRPLNPPLHQAPMNPLRRRPLLRRGTSFSKRLRSFRCATIRSEAALGLGNARLLQQDLEGAIDAYRDSLVALVSNDRARNNLLRALQLKQEQEQQQEQQEQQEPQEPGNDEQDPNSEEDGQPESEPQNDDQQSPNEDQQKKSDGDEAPQEQQQKPQEQQQKPQDSKQDAQDQSGAKENKKEKPPAQNQSGVRLLDAMREQEKPLAPFQMRLLAPKPPPEKDW